MSSPFLLSFEFWNLFPSSLCPAFIAESHVPTIRGLLSSSSGGRCGPDFGGQRIWRRLRQCCGMSTNFQEGKRKLDINTLRCSKSDILFWGKSHGSVWGAMGLTLASDLVVSLASSVSSQRAMGSTSPFTAGDLPEIDSVISAPRNCVFSAVH